MFGNFSYMILATVFAIVPLLFIVIKYNKIIFQYKKLISVLFITWFISSIIINHYTRKDGFWFNPAETNIGLYVAEIPLEDFLSSAAIGLLLPISTLVLSLNEEKGE